MSARLERLKELLKQSPADSFVRFALAKETEKSGDPAAAIAMLEDLLRDDPAYVGAYLHLAVLKQTRGDDAGALDAYDRGIEAAAARGDRHALAELRNARLNFELENP